MKASVIIPNWNGKNLLTECLVSLGEQVFTDFEIIVVDNASTDGSIEYIEQNFLNVTLVKLNKNVGFAKAINRGVKKALGEYVVFLNNDTKVDKLWLKELVKTADDHPEVASVGSKVLNFFDPKIIDGVGILINEVGQAKSLGWQEENLGQYEKDQYVFGVTGGAGLFKKDIFIKVGMFDEHYFMYSEEVDWAFRAQFLGYKSIYCSKAVVLHKHKSTAKKLPQHLEYWQFKNMTQTIIKDFPTKILLKKWRWLKILLVHFNTIFYQVKNGFFWPPLLTEIWLMINLPRLLKARFEIQSTKKINDDYIESFLVEKKLKLPSL